MLRPISRAAAEWPFFAVALAGAGLPVEDLDGAGQQFFALGDALAFGGYLIAGPDALLRSIVVPPSAQKRGHGQVLVTALLRQLEGQGVERAWLLTTSAGPFFERLGFAHADRHMAPAAIAATPQFQGICPSSAAFMCRPTAATTT
jgi:arsenate reductase